MSLEGKKALITGGGTGIGAAVARLFAAQGCHVAVTGRRDAPLEATASAAPERIATKTANVGDRDSVRELFAWFREEIGPVDILVNSAGVNVVDRAVAKLDPDDWDRLMQINASGAYYCIREALDDMRPRGDGLIVNISSIAGKRAGLLGGLAYNASKFAMSALGITVGLEEGPRGIRVTNVYPGEVNTPILENRPEPVSEEHKQQILQPEDVADAVLMLAHLPPRAHVPELIIKPTSQSYV